RDRSGRIPREPRDPAPAPARVRRAGALGRGRGRLVRDHRGGRVSDLRRDAKDLAARGDYPAAIALLEAAFAAPGRHADWIALGADPVPPCVPVPRHADALKHADALEASLNLAVPARFRLKLASVVIAVAALLGLRRLLGLSVRLVARGRVVATWQALRAL